MKKVLLSVLALILIAWIVYAGYFFLEEKRVRDYSTACMDKVREEIWNEYLWNIALIDSEKVDGVYHYFWMCSDETSDYYFSCAVTNKDNVDVEIETEEIQTEEPEVNIENIDTEEERKEWCKNEEMKLFNDMIPNWEFVNLVWEGLEEETREEWRLTIIQRNLRIVYNQDWKEWFWPWICETNFIEWNQKVLFSQSYMNI